MRCYCVMHHGQPLELVEKDIPTPQGSEVLVKVKAAGLCHTDLHLWEGHYDLGGGKKLMLADRGIKPPMTLSHEIVGEVVGTGKTVLVHPWIGCGDCAACQRGEENICIKPQSLGVINAGYRVPANVLGKTDQSALGDTLFAVTLEPEGGSPTGQPTSAPVFTGKLIATE